jgi:nicotinamidase-related amidase
MTMLASRSSALLLIDFQIRLMTAIAAADGVIANARRLQAAAQMLEVPVLLTEQNPAGLGPTMGELRPAAEAAGSPILAKQSFDACRAPGFFEHLPERPALVLAGCEAHVCVLQTALGLMAAGRRVHVVRDAVGARRPESKTAALERLARHGAEIVTTEMVLFEWLETAGHPRFREVMALIK